MSKRKRSENGTQHSTIKKFRKSCHNLLCDNSAVGSSRFCFSHGGDNSARLIQSGRKRCLGNLNITSESQCSRLAQSGSDYCARHAREPPSRCHLRNCQQDAIGMSGLCPYHRVHFEKRCSYPNCRKTVNHNAELCRIHNGKELCQHIDEGKRCGRKATTGKTHCFNHDTKEIKHHADEKTDTIMPPDPFPESPQIINPLEFQECSELDPFSALQALQEREGLYFGTPFPFDLLPLDVCEL